MSTQSSNGVVSLSFRPGSASHVQVTTDPAAGPVQLRVIISLPTGPLVQYGGGSSPNTPDFTVSNGYGNFAIAHADACGGVSLEATEVGHVFSAAAY